MVKLTNVILLINTRIFGVSYMNEYLCAVYVLSGAGVKKE